MSGITVTLLSSDNIEFPNVKIEIASCSKTLKTMLDHLGVDNDTCEIIPVPNVEGEILQLFLNWAEKNSDLQAAASEEQNSWQKDFFESVNLNKMVELTKAANYLDCDVLLDACTTFLARMIEGKTVVQIRYLQMSRYWSKQWKDVASSKGVNVELYIPRAEKSVRDYDKREMDVRMPWTSENLSSEHNIDGLASGDSCVVAATGSLRKRRQSPNPAESC